MSNSTAFTIFCEFDRQDSNGQDTLVGTITGSLRLPRPPANATFGQVGIHTYTRILVDLANDPPRDSTMRILVDGNEIISTVIDPEIWRREFAEARMRGLSRASVISRTAPGLRLPANAKRVEVVVQVDGSEFLAGEMPIEYFDNAKS